MVETAAVATSRFPALERFVPTVRVLAAIGLVLAVAWAGWPALSAIDLARTELRWIPLMLLAEALSAAAAVAAQVALLGGRGILAPPGRRRADAPPVGVIGATTLAATAIGFVLPGGPAISAAYAARRYRRAGIPMAEAIQSQVVMAGAAGVALGLVAGAGLAVPGAAHHAGLEGVGLLLAWMGAAASLLVGVAVIGVVRLSRGRDALADSRFLRWVVGCPPMRGGERAARPPRLSLTRISVCCGFGVLVLAFDCAVLVLGLQAADVSVPWSSLPLAYGLAQLISLIPLTPGGSGIVEGGLGALIVVPGATDGGVALAVVLYRAISWGAVIAAGSVALLVLRRQSRRAQSSRAQSA